MNENLHSKDVSPHVNQTSDPGHPSARTRCPQKEIIRKADDFGEIFADGRRWHEKYMIIVYKSGSERRVGFAVSKRLGNAVKRNRMKRRMREIYRFRRTQIGSLEMILVAKSGLERARFQDLQEGFDRFLRSVKAAP